MRAIALMTVFLLMAPAMALANVGPPSSGGHIVGDPIGVEGVSITHETLNIDLRPLAANGLAQVEVLYHLHNGGEEKKLELLFVSGSANVVDFHVSLGDEPIASAPAKDAELPASWQAPKQTPGLHDGGGLDYLRYGANHATPVGFIVTVPSGPHDLKVRYAAEASTHFYGRPTVYRQFAYVLAPARAWSEFGGLDVEIHLPKNWHAACEPALTREGDTLKEYFAELPADAIALTLQAPEGWAYRPLTYASIAFLGLAGFMGTVVCWRGGRSRGRHLAASIETQSNWLNRHAWPTALGLGAAWGFAVLATGLFAIFGPNLTLPQGQANHYGYGQGFAVLGVFFLSTLALAAGFTITQLTAVFIHRRDLAKVCRASVVTGDPAEPSHALEPAVGPVSNEKSSPPAQ